MPGTPGTPATLPVQSDLPAQRPPLTPQIQSPREADLWSSEGSFAAKPALGLGGLWDILTVPIPLPGREQRTHSPAAVPSSSSSSAAPSHSSSVPVLMSALVTHRRLQQALSQAGPRSGSWPHWAWTALIGGHSVFPPCSRD